MNITYSTNWNQLKSKRNRWPTGWISVGGLEQLPWASGLDLVSVTLPSVSTGTSWLRLSHMPRSVSCSQVLKVLPHLKLILRYCSKYCSNLKAFIGMWGAGDFPQFKKPGRMRSFLFSSSTNFQLSMRFATAETGVGKMRFNVSYDLILSKSGEASKRLVCDAQSVCRC